MHSLWSERWVDTLVVHTVVYVGSHLASIERRVDHKLDCYGEDEP